MTDMTNDPNGINPELTEAETSSESAPSAETSVPASDSTSQKVSNPVSSVEYDPVLKEYRIILSAETLAAGAIDREDRVEQQAARLSRYATAIAQIDSMDPDTKAAAAVTLSPDATYGEKVHALRTASKMTIKELSEKSGLSSRAIRYIENGERIPSVEALKSICDAFGVRIDYFMDQETYESELASEQFYAEVKDKYGSRGLAQAKKIRQQTDALFAGGELSDADKQAFIEEMQEIFFDAKNEARKYTPKKYRKDE